jgi:hypothetical protein
MIRRKYVADFFRHPFVILAATAIISGLLVPFITQQWRDQGRKADLKAQLIADGGKNVATILAAAQFWEFGGESTDPKEISAAVQAWEIEHVVISSKIRAYLIDPSLGPDWDRLSIMLRAAYGAGADNPRRTGRLAMLRQYLEGSDINWNALDHGYSDTAQFADYNRAWFQLREALLNRYAEIAKRILNAKSR